MLSASGRSAMPRSAAKLSSLRPITASSVWGEEKGIVFGAGS